MRRGNGLIIWYGLPTGEVLEQLGTDPDLGLGSDAAAQRLREHGPNELAEAKKRSPLSIFLEQFKATLVLVLLGAAVVSAVVGQVKDAAVITVTIVLSGLLGFIQEYRAEKSLAAIKRLTSPTARAIRNGQPVDVEARALVPGDIILVEAGNLVPADARLANVVNLRVDESTLTGESVSVEKSTEQLSGEAIGLGDRKNMIFAGTMVTYGNGKAVVVKTGMQTEIGKIAGSLGETPREQTPLQQRLGQIGNLLGGLVIALCALVAAVGILRGEKPHAMFMTAISLAVAAVPEELPVVITIILALGVRRMVKRQAIIRRLLAVETLGAITTICSDKTGTLTQNEMTVSRTYAGDRLVLLTGEGYRPEGAFLFEGQHVDPCDDEHLSLLLIMGSLSNNARLRQVTEAEGARTLSTWSVIGDPTEAALVVAGMKAGIVLEELAGEFPRLAEIPFDSDRKLMTTIHPAGKHSTLVGGKQFVSFTKGASDLVLERCTRVFAQGSAAVLTDERKAQLREVNASLAGQGYRVLGLASRGVDSVDANPDPEVLERQLVFVGFMAMSDPPRPEAREAVQLCRTAGIRPVMITGDHKLTATSIAREIGIFREGDLAVTGAELDAMSNEEFTRQVERVAVYARVSPEHKVRIVDALKAGGHVVAMTGDGVNDAPALRRADVGSAMGIAGSDVAKEAADMVLADDNFATIVAAIREGRAIYDNMRKILHFLLSSHGGQLSAILVAVVVGLQRPLVPIQILWVNLVTNALAALSLGSEPPEPGVMERPPRKMQESVFADGMGSAIIIQSFFISLIILAAFWLGYRGRPELLDKGRTMAFATLAFGVVVHAFNARSLRQSLLKLGLASNRAMIVAAAAAALLQVLVMVVPVLQGIFGTIALNKADWLMTLGLSLSPVVFVESAKAFSKVCEASVTRAQ